MEGFLFKWTNYINGWQQRYFTLKDGILSYYSTASDIDTGCKGALNVSACEVIVHISDACRLDILIPGEQRYYLRAQNSQDRQKWVVALGSCKAGVMAPDVSASKRLQQNEKSIDAKRSELRIYRDLLFHQIKEITNTFEEKTKETDELKERTNALKATCDTFLSTSDELVQLLLLLNKCSGGNHAPQNHSLSSPILVDGGSPILAPPQLLLSTPTCSPQSARPDIENHSREDGFNSTMLKSSTSSVVTSTKSQLSTPALQTNGMKSKSLSSCHMNTHLRSLRLSRPYQTFFSVMEFSFEDLLLSPSSPTGGGLLAAVEFLASARCGLKFFGLLATCDPITGEPLLTRLGCLQTVYAEVLLYIVRIEVSVKNLCTNALNSSDIQKHSLTALQITLGDILEAELATGSYQNADSAYNAMLWLARALNFSMEFIKNMFATVPHTGQSGDTNEFVKNAAVKAYAATLREFHNWSVRGTASVILNALPSFIRINDAFLLIEEGKRAEMTPSQEALAQLQLDADRYADAIHKCLQEIHKMFILRNLDPIFCVENRKDASNGDSMLFNSKL